MMSVFVFLASDLCDVVEAIPLAKLLSIFLPMRNVEILSNDLENFQTLYSYLSGKRSQRVLLIFAVGSAKAGVETQ